MNYDKYLQSELWKKVRAAALWHAGGKCQLCGQPHAQLEVHHNSYNRLGGQERPEDLVVLCSDCHRRHHKVKEEKDLLWMG